MQTANYATLYVAKPQKIYDFFEANPDQLVRLGEMIREEMLAFSIPLPKGEKK